MMATRMNVAQRFHDHLRKEGLDNVHRLPFGEVRRFMDEHVHLTVKGHTLPNGSIQKWYKTWRNSDSVVSTAIGRDTTELAQVSVGKRGQRSSRTDSIIMPNNKLLHTIILILNELFN